MLMVSNLLVESQIIPTLAASEKYDAEDVLLGGLVTRRASDWGGS